MKVFVKKLNSLTIVMGDRLSLSPEMIQIRHWNYLETSLSSHTFLVGKHYRGMNVNSADSADSILVIHVF